MTTLTFPPNSNSQTLCKVISNNEIITSTSKTTTTTINENSQTKNHQNFNWKPWEWFHSKPDKRTTQVEEESELFTDQIVLLQRGECIFEEKALNAQLMGAKAAIIANNEVC